MTNEQEIRPIPVVTAFLRRDDRILLVRRSGQVGSYRGLWAGISGYLEDETPLAQALREVREETGLQVDDVVLRAVADPLLVVDGDRHWLVHPFLFDVLKPDVIRLDWEHVEMVWIRPKELPAYATVPALLEAWEATMRAEKDSAHR
ncbi:MAG: NUDIX pyrophosphatase [Anaerolineae bacterium]|nr:NUDIX pyrophosphatase [Anaerolineae bacterium]